MDAKDLAQFKKVLLEQKRRLLKNAEKTLNEELQLSADDLPDEMDLASVELNQSMVFKLRERERMLLQKIDKAIEKLDKGSFGVCERCEEEIGRKRLEARPVTELCIKCKEEQEHKEKIYA